MTRRTQALLIVAFLAGAIIGGLFFTVVASAATISADSPRYDYQRWIDQSRMPFPDVEVRVEYVDDPCGEGMTGCASPFEPRIWLSTNSAGRFNDRTVFFHEMGHEFIFLVVNSKRQDRLSRLFRVSPARWQGYTEEGVASLYGYCSQWRIGRSIVNVSFGKAGDLTLPRKRIVRGCQLFRKWSS